MLLAEALSLRADLQTRQALYRERIKRALIVQEGYAPPEDPNVLLSKLRSESEELSRVIAAINHTNERNYITTDQGSMSINRAVSRYEHLKKMHAALRDLANYFRSSDVYTRAQVRNVRSINSGELENEADEIARDVKKLFAALQKADWSVLVEGYDPSEFVSES